MSRVLIASDMASVGSGYRSIVENLAAGLQNSGHEVMVIGLRYFGEEHHFPFRMVQAFDFRDVFAEYFNLSVMWKPDVFVCAFDVPQQIYIKNEVSKMRGIKQIPHIGIMPLESGPLTMTWAMNLQRLDKVFMISEFATQECLEKNVQAEHIQIGMNTKAWRMPTKEEKKELRLKMFGVEDDETFVILTVADNQERKNLSAAMRIVGQFREDVSDNIVYAMVTRKNLEVGWNLDDEAVKRGLMGKFQCFDRGMPVFPDLWNIYAASDCFLLTSKAEGLGLPVLEAMSVGLPVIATECGALIEHLTRGDGWLVEPEYVVDDDPFGNTNRFFISIKDGVDALTAVYSGLDVENAVKKARRYVESRTWDIPIAQLNKAIEEVTNVKE